MVKLKGGLQRTGGAIAGAFIGAEIGDELYEDLEVALLQADAGADATVFLLDELQVHVAPVFLGDGERLFDGMAADVKLEPTRVVDSPTVTHLRYRVLRS